MNGWKEEGMDKGRKSNAGHVAAGVERTLYPDRRDWLSRRLDAWVVEDMDG